MEEIQIHIINHSANPLPAYATAGSSGMDLRAHLSEPVVLKPMQRALIPEDAPAREIEDEPDQHDPGDDAGPRPTRRRGGDHVQ